MWINNRRQGLPAGNYCWPFTRLAAGDKTQRSPGVQSTHTTKLQKEIPQPHANKASLKHLDPLVARGAGLRKGTGKGQLCTKATEPWSAH